MTPHACVSKPAASIKCVTINTISTVNSNPGAPAKQQLVCPRLWPHLKAMLAELKAEV